MFSANEVADLQAQTSTCSHTFIQENMVQLHDLYILVKSQVPFILPVLPPAATEILGFALLTCRKFHLGLLSQIYF